MQAERYIQETIDRVKSVNNGEEEFIDAVTEVLESLEPLLRKEAQFHQHGILERLVEPDRQISFSVPWMDDNNRVQVNRGFRVQFNSFIGPYKGGLRFHPSVNASIMKFLGFEQTFKNALTGLAIGGGKGGSNFDPKGKSEAEVMRFTQSFVTELYRHIGKDMDIPAGDIGVGAREIGYMYGHYRRIVDEWEPGVFTGKGLDYGGSLGRTEATGFGLVYFVQEILKDRGDSLRGKTVVVSGSGNVALHAIEKATELGATCITASDSSGYVVDEKGIDLEILKEIKLKQRLRIHEYVERTGRGRFVEGSRNVWEVRCDIALPCATQNEIDENAAYLLAENGVYLVGEGANMPTSLKAQKVLKEKGIILAPAKAANAGGVAVSGLEMSQNSLGVRWSFTQVDGMLKTIMRDIYKSTSSMATRFGDKDDLTMGANIAGFIKVAQAMIDQGL